MALQLQLQQLEKEGKKKEVKDAEARIEQLNALFSSFEDNGVVLDCVVWHDGKGRSSY